MNYEKTIIIEGTEYQAITTCEKIDCIVSLEAQNAIERNIIGGIIGLLVGILIIFLVSK